MICIRIFYSMDCISTFICSVSAHSFFCVQVLEAKVNEVKINEAREHYRAVAVRASLLYFIMNDLNKINPMYQFSLKVTGRESCELTHSPEADGHYNFALYIMSLNTL